MQLSKLMTQNTNRQGVEDLLAKLQKECSNMEGEASSLQRDLADSQTSCEQLQGALAESRWAAGLHASGGLGAALLVLFASACSRMMRPARTPAGSCRGCYQRAGELQGHVRGSQQVECLPLFSLFFSGLQSPTNSCRGLWQTALCFRNARPVPRHH